MDYPRWGDGLRISVGTDEEIDKCLAALRELVDQSPSPSGRGPR
jgi:histidinol-phosphate aminotransferase